MQKQRIFTINNVALISMLLLGIVLLVFSAFNNSSFLSIVGLGMIFWGVILSYVKPAKQVALTLLTVSAGNNTDNVERILKELDLIEKGVYLPPKNLKNFESSLIFIPEKPNTLLPIPEENSETLFSQQKTGLFLTPPGLALLNLFEQELGKSFNKIDFAQLQMAIPKLLIENLEMAEAVQIQLQDKMVTMRITNNMLRSVCAQTDEQPRTHKQVGCLLTSAFACALAKCLRKPITVQNEAWISETKTTVVKYNIEEE